MKIKQCEFYNQQGFCLYFGDCIQVMNCIPENSINMIFADPPYYLSNGGITCKNGKMVSVNKGKWDQSNGLDYDFNFHMSWIQACKKILKDNGTIWISGTYHSIYACGLALLKHGFKILNDIAWYKPNASPNLSCKCFTASHETIIWAKKDNNTKYTYNYDHMKKGDWHIKDVIKNENKQMRSVWSISTTPKSEKLFGNHPTQKPISLLKRIVLSSTNKDDLILDPFTGSSTTGIVAKMYNRRFIGIDSNQEYLELSVARLNGKN